MSFIKKMILLFLVSAALYGCYSDNAASLYPAATFPGGINCDTANVSYSTAIEPIFIQYCALQDCHASASPLGGYILDTYNGVLSTVLSGKLVGAISHSPGYSPMPKDAAMLSDCDIGLITSWINQGAQDD
jgi:hypothetical protein